MGSGGFASLVPNTDEPQLSCTGRSAVTYGRERTSDDASTPLLAAREHSPPSEWARNVRTLVISFVLSGVYTLCTFFLPFLRNIPVFGRRAAATWLWTLNPSPAYVGQGVIMGPETTLHSTSNAHSIIMSWLSRPACHHILTTFLFSSASRGHHWLGSSLAACEKGRLGPRPRGQLGIWQQRLDCMGVFGHHARRCRR